MMLKVRYPWGITTKSVTGITLAIKRYPWQQQVLRVKYPWGLLLRAGKTGKHAGTQKRHVSGSAGGQGGRFAKKQIAKDLPGPVQDTMKAFQVMRKMIRLERARKGDGKDVHHKNHNTADNRTSNLSVTSRKFNRSRNRRRP